MPKTYFSRIPTDDILSDKYSSKLSKILNTLERKDEFDRFTTYLHVRDRLLFGAGRLISRYILHRELEIPLETIDLCRSELGRPFLVGLLLEYLGIL